MAQTNSNLPTSESQTSTDNSIQESTDTLFNNLLKMIEEYQIDFVKDIKRDATADEIFAENKYLKTPLNTTDPIVWHDPTFTRDVIVRQLDTEIGDDGVQATDAVEVNYKKIGVLYPNIEVNQRVLNEDDIIFMELKSYNNIVPELTLIIYDQNNTIRNLSSPGIDSRIILELHEPINGVHHKIKLSFHITDIDYTTFNGQPAIKYNSVMKIDKLWQKYNTSMNYPKTNQWPGCSKCKQSEAKKPNSWEMLHYIANECKLGFASTEKCKDISDRSYRNFNKYDTLLDALYGEREFAGSSEDEAVFDWWVDVFGYLVMVNVPYILHSDIENKQLAIYGIKNIQHVANTNKAQEPVAVLMPRTITDSNNKTTLDGGGNNLLIKSFKIISDNSIRDEGTSSSYNVFMPLGSGGDNILSQFDIEVKENSIAGEHTDRYQTQRTPTPIIDMSGCSKIMRRQIFNKYFEIKRAKMLLVTLDTANYGIQRGTLINVALMETNPRNKSTMQANIANTVEVGKKAYSKSQELLKGESNADGLRYEDMTNNPSAEIINKGLSGMYYVDGVVFRYDATVHEANRIVQDLYLIKKGVWGTYTSEDSYLSMHPDAFKK